MDRARADDYHARRRRWPALRFAARPGSFWQPSVCPAYHRAIGLTEDGLRWHAAFSNRDLPRSLISALATDGQRLYVGGWASWSAWDGQVWEHHDKDPELAGQVITAIAARPGEVWIGTQKQGCSYMRTGATRIFMRCRD